MNRHYSSAQGRFTQVDPIGMGAASLSDPQSLNLYAYCENDPINFVDPDGLFLKKLFGWIGKAIKVVAKVFAVVLAVAAVLAFSWGFAAIGWAALAGAGVFALIGWGNGKLAQLAAGIAFPGGGYGGFRTPDTFPTGTGVSGVSGFLGAQRGRVIGKIITDSARAAIVDAAVTSAIEALRSRKCRDLIGGDNPAALLKKLHAQNHIREGNLARLSRRTALAITDGYGEDAYITVDEYFFFSDKEVQMTRADIIGSSVKTARAVALLHELSHATGRFYHKELGHKAPSDASRPAPIDKKYGEATLDRRIYEACFGGK